MNIVARAAVFAKKRHGDQKDDCGHNYYEAHILQVWNIVRQVSDDLEVQCAALLHDTIEDTQTTYDHVRQEFGYRVADLVMEVTHEGSNDNKGYFFPRLKTQEGILIKFADRLSNVSRMEAWGKSRRRQYLRKSKFWVSEV